MNEANKKKTEVKLPKPPESMKPQRLFETFSKKNNGEKR